MFTQIIENIKNSLRFRKKFKFGQRVYIVRDGFFTAKGKVIEIHKDNILVAIECNENIKN